MLPERRGCPGKAMSASGSPAMPLAPGVDPLETEYDAQRTPYATAEGEPTLRSLREWHPACQPTTTLRAAVCAEWPCPGCQRLGCRIPIFLDPGASDASSQQAAAAAPHPRTQSPDSGAPVHSAWTGLINSVHAGLDRVGTLPHGCQDSKLGMLGSFLSCAWHYRKVDQQALMYEIASGQVHKPAQGKCYIRAIVCKLKVTLPSPIGQAIGIVCL